MNQVLLNIKSHLPVYVGIAIVIVSSLQDQGILHLSNGAVTIINAVLAALGLGVLHVRQQAAMKAAGQAKMASRVL